MANEKTMRSYFHLIQNELNVVAGACGNVEVILIKIKADTNPLELKDIIFSKIQESSISCSQNPGTELFSETAS